MTAIELSFEEAVEGLEASEIERVIRAVLRAEDADLNLSFVFIDDAAIRQINAEFLQHDYATDVITFDLRDDGPGIDAEIMVSVETARRESKEREQLFESELLLYCVHGTLHLLGYDDHDEQDRELMHQRQLDILNSLGYEMTA